MKLTLHALTRLHERAPNLFKKYGFSLTATVEGNQKCLNSMFQDMKKIEIPVSEMGRVLHTMELNNQNEIPTWYVLDDMVLIEYNDRLVTTYPRGKNNAPAIQKADMEQSFNDIRDYLAFAKKNPTKVTYRIVAPYDNYYYIVELFDEKSNIKDYVKMNRTEVGDFQLFEASDKNNIEKIRTLDTYLSYMSDEQFLQQFEVIGKNQELHYYRGELNGFILYAQKNKEGHIVFLDYARFSPAVCKLLDHFEKVENSKTCFRILPEVTFGINQTGAVNFFHNQKLCHTILKPSKEVLTYLKYQGQYQNHIDVEQMFNELHVKIGKYSMRGNAGLVKYKNKKYPFLRHGEHYNFVTDELATWVQHFMKISEKGMISSGQYLYEDEEYTYYGLRQPQYEGCFRQHKTTKELFIATDDKTITKFNHLKHEEDSVQSEEKCWNIVGGFNMKKIIVNSTYDYLYLNAKNGKLSFIPDDEYNKALENINHHGAIQDIVQQSEIIAITDTSCEHAKNIHMRYLGLDHTLVLVFDTAVITSHPPTEYTEPYRPEGFSL